MPLQLMKHFRTASDATKLIKAENENDHAFGAKIVT